MSKTLNAKPDFNDLTQIALSLKKELQPVQKSDCIGCLVRQDFHASSGQGRVFSDEPSDPLDGSRHTDGRGPQRQQPAGSKAFSCHAKMNSHSGEQDNSFAAPSHHGG